MQEVDDICDKIAIIDKGNIIAEGTSEELKNIIEDKRVYHVKVNKEIKDLDKKLLSITGIEKVSFLEGEYIVTTLKSSNMISKIVEIISKENIDIQNIFSEEPTLENVFLALTGKKLRE